MNGISKKQKEALARFKRKPTPSNVLEILWGFLNDKPEEEPLDPAWLDIWKEHKHHVVRYLPKRAIQEIEKSLQSIQTIDEEIFSIRVDDDAQVTFLLGAGASAPSGIPTVDKLLPELWNRARKIGREDLDRLAKWCGEQGITNIEDLLTAAYISDFAATNRKITSLLDYFLFSGGQEPSEEEKYLTRSRRPIGTSEIDVSSIKFLQDTLQTLFGLLTSTMISASPNRTHEAIVDFIEGHKNTSLITTNYDGCMDEAILKTGKSIKKTIGSEDDSNNGDDVELLKMHGSINWAYCDSCQHVREFDLLKLKNIYEEDELSYPVIGICNNCGGLRRPLLVPPLSFKFLMFPNLIDIWNSARQSIEAANYLVVVGYSFSEADTYITKIVSRSMSIKENQKILIVDTNPKLVTTLRGRFSAHIDGFDEKRIFSACESSEKILPEILSSMLSSTETQEAGNRDNETTGPDVR